MSLGMYSDDGALSSISPVKAASIACAMTSPLTSNMTTKTTSITASPRAIQQVAKATAQKAAGLHFSSQMTPSSKYAPPCSLRTLVRPATHLASIMAVTPATPDTSSPSTTDTAPFISPGGLGLRSVSSQPSETSSVLSTLRPAGVSSSGGDFSFNTANASAHSTPSSSIVDAKSLRRTVSWQSAGTPLVDSSVDMGASGLNAMAVFASISSCSVEATQPDNAQAAFTTPVDAGIDSNDDISATERTNAVSGQKRSRAEMTPDFDAMPFTQMTQMDNCSDSEMYENPVQNDRIPSPHDNIPSDSVSVLHGHADFSGEAQYPDDALVILPSTTEEDTASRTPTLLPSWAPFGRLEAPCLSTQWKQMLSNRWPGREGVIDTMAVSVDGATSVCATNYVLYGGPGTGKSEFIKELLISGHSLHALCRCSSAHTLRNVFGLILREVADGICSWLHQDGLLVSAMVSLCARDQEGRKCAAAIARWTSAKWHRLVVHLYNENMRSLYAVKGSTLPQEAKCGTARCHTMEDLCTELQALASLRASDLSGKGMVQASAHLPMHIVLDNAERLLAIDRNIVVALLNLAQVVSRPVGFIFITSDGPALLSSYNGVDFPPIELYFPRATPAAITSMLIQAAAPVEDAALFASCVGMVDRVFGFLVGYDFREMLYLVRHFFKVYQDIIGDGHCSASATAQLQQRARPEIELVRSRLLHRDSVGADAKKARKSVETNKCSASSSIMLSRERSVDLELPYLCKLILVAAFCASHNPAATDKRLFASGKPQSVPKSRNGLIIAQQKRKALVAGPRLFTLERLMQLFYCLLAGNDPESVQACHQVVDAELSHQIGALVSMGLLTRVSDMHDSISVKFRCNVSEEAVEAVARTCSPPIDVHKYLFDPLT